MEAKLNKSTQVHYLCQKKSNWSSLWLNIPLLTPVLIDCLIDNMRLIYHPGMRTTQDAPGVEVRATKFGSLDSVDYLDDLKLRVLSIDYFERIISTLETNNELIRNVDMIGASYDFRRAPNELITYFQNLTDLIEEFYMQNNYRSVSLVCHSMGCLNTVFLLNQHSQEWKDVYVRRVISLAAPWAGSVGALSAMLFGDTLGIPFLNGEKIRALQSTFPSLTYLFPREPVFPADQVLIETPEYNYTLGNFDEMFEDAGLMNQLEMWRDTKDIANLMPPNVELWCLYGTGKKTPSKLVFPGPIKLNGRHRLIEGDGDGTVNIESLQACELFKQLQEKPVYTKQFHDHDHMMILRSKMVTEFISSAIMAGRID